MDVFHLFIFYFIFLDHHDFVDRGTTNVQFTYRHELHGGSVSGLSASFPSSIAPVLFSTPAHHGESRVMNH